VPDRNIINADQIPVAPLEFIPGSPITLPMDLAERVLPLKPELELTVQELTDVVNFVAALANAIAKVIGSNIIVGVFAFIPVVPKLIAALGGLNAIPTELQYMSQKQKDALIKSLKDQLTFSSDTKTVVGIALDIAFGIKALIGLFKK
jgi:hypothetical protein